MKCNQCNGKLHVYRKKIRIVDEAFNEYKVFAWKRICENGHDNTSKFMKLIVVLKVRLKQILK